MKYGLFSLVLVTAFIGAMERDPDKPEHEEQDDISCYTDQDYETFKNMWRVYAICRDAIKKAHQGDDHDGDDCATPGQSFWPGVEYYKGQTKKGLFLRMYRYPEGLYTPLGKFSVAGNCWQHLGADVMVFAMIRERIGIEPSAFTSNAGEAPTKVKKIPTVPTDKNLFRKVVDTIKLIDDIPESNAFIGLWKIVSIDGEELEDPVLKEGYDIDYISKQQVEEVYCDMMRRFRKEDEFEKKIKPLLQHESVMPSSQFLPFFHAMHDPIE